eukprot:6212919-Pleurochrysis_carterae.AAC.6
MARRRNRLIDVNAVELTSSRTCCTISFRCSIVLSCAAQRAIAKSAVSSPCKLSKPASSMPATSVGAFPAVLSIIVRAFRARAAERVQAHHISYNGIKCM